MSARAANDSVLARLLEAALPEGGYVLVQVESYFDESGSHCDSKTLCVAGYLFHKKDAVRLKRKWDKVLNRFGLPFFRMSDCAHGNEPFDKLTKLQCIAVETRMIKLIKDHSAMGFAVTLDLDEWKRHRPLNRVIGDDYSFCAHVIIAGVGQWIKEHPETDKCAYFFEAGHKHQKQANIIMTTIFNNSRLQSDYRYAAHAFIPKCGNPPVQAADLLAWQWYTDRKRTAQKLPHRKDLESLLEHKHMAVHIGPNKIRALSDMFSSAGINDNIVEVLHAGVE
jgi:hypothetical protein